MKKFFKLIPLLFLFFSAFASNVNWTLFSYMKANNDLREETNRAIDKMANACKWYMTPETSAKIIVEVVLDDAVPDRTYLYDLTENGKILKDSFDHGDTQQEIEDLGVWVKANAPAERYSFVITGHGNGIAGVIGLDLPDLKSAVESVVTSLGKSLDLMTFGDCSMGLLEVAYEFKDYVDFCMASENTTYISSYSLYKATEAIILNNNIIRALDISSITTRELIDDISKEGRTISSVKSNVLYQLVNIINNFSSQILACAVQEPIEIKTALLEARSLCTQFTKETNIDLYDYCLKLVDLLEVLIESAQGSYLNNLRDTVKLLKEIMAILPEIVCTEIHGPKRSNVHGLAIYCPTVIGSINAEYYTLDFVIDNPNGWIKVLEFMFP